MNLVAPEGRRASFTSKLQDWLFDLEVVDAGEERSGPNTSPRKASVKEVGLSPSIPSGVPPIVRTFHLLDLLSRSSTFDCSRWLTADSSVVNLPWKSFIEVSMTWIVRSRWQKFALSGC